MQALIHLIHVSERRKPETVLAKADLPAHWYRLQVRPTAPECRTDASHLMAHVCARVALTTAKPEAVVVTNVRVHLKRVTVPAAASEPILVEYQLDFVGLALAPLLGVHALCTSCRLDDLCVGGLEGGENISGGSEIAVEVGVEPD